MQNLLFEIGTEELPAGYIRPALKQIESIIKDKLKEAGLNFNQVITTGTPRRLTLSTAQIDEMQESVEKEISGPSSSIAFDADGNPTNVGKGFAKSQGVDVKDLKIKETKKGKYCYVQKAFKGKPALELLPEILSGIIKSLEFPKKMIWKSDGIPFARPIRTLTALFGTEIINFEINGVKSDRVVMGNPYITQPEMFGRGNAISLENADFDTYEQKLKDEKVIVDIEKRKRILLEKSQNILSKYNATFDDEKLIDELTNLVEYPAAIECEFDENFLDLPQEVIISAMKGHQRYCPVIDKEGNLRAKFVSVLNMDDKNAEMARDGNERVLRARLADARFFFEDDKKVSLTGRVKDLKGVTYQKKLGTLLDRANRISDLAGFIAERFEFSADLIKDVRKTALLCKADLTTAMVGEFPDLQGVMGKRYAICDGENESVANAIEEHYLPRYANDKLPESDIGAVVSLADKFDMVAGCFSIGLIPTGSQDPYALRRCVQGIIRIIEKRGEKLSIKDVLNYSLSQLSAQISNNKGDDAKIDDRAIDKILDFFKDRLYQNYIDQGYKYDIINSILASGIDDLVNISLRLGSLTGISTESYWNDLVAVVERTFNISKKHRFQGEVNSDLMIDPEEKILWEAYTGNKDEIHSLIADKDYKKASELYCKVFLEPVHSFFDKVFVNVEDEKVKNNRLATLKTINELYSINIADLSKIVVGK